MERISTWLFKENKGGYILCGTSRGFIYLGLTENNKGYTFCGSVQVEGISTRLFKDNKGGYIPCASLLVKDFTRLLEISRTGGCLGTGCRHGLLPNQYKNLCLFSSSLYSLFFRCVLFISALLLSK